MSSCRFTTLNLNPKERKAVMGQAVDWLQGSTKGVKPLLERATLDEMRDSAREAVNKLEDENDALARMHATYKAALYRDAHLAFAGRGALLAGSEDGRQVELGEVPKIAIIYDQSA